MRGVLAVFGSLALALGAWQAVVVVFDLPHFILPGPSKVGHALVDNAGLLAEHAMTTGLEVLIGLVLGGALGALTALGLAYSRSARALLKPMLAFTQALRDGGVDYFLPGHERVSGWLVADPGGLARPRSDLRRP